MENKFDYIPGTCNIGPAELKARKNVAVFSGVLSIAVIILLYFTHADKLWRLVLFIPAGIFGVSFQQWYNKFCVRFGLSGVFNFGDMGKTYTVEQKEDFNKDRRKAWKMINMGILFGILMAILFYILPA